MRKFSIIFITLAIILYFALPASATLILSQPRTQPGDPYPCNLGWCNPDTWPSGAVYAAPWDDADTPFGTQVLAENFVVKSPTTITEIKIWGGYWWQDKAPANDNFTVIFHNDAGGSIGTKAAEPGFTTSRDDAGATWVNMKWCSTCNGSALVFEYTLTMTDPVFLGSETYWVEIYNDTTGHTANNDFFWVWGYLDLVNGIDGLAWTQASAPGSDWNYDSTGNFAIEITAVPEPSTLLLLGSGLVGLAFYSRRKFRKIN